MSRELRGHKEKIETWVSGECKEFYFYAVLDAQQNWLKSGQYGRMPSISSLCGGILEDFAKKSVKRR
jgi:hypothetical protein